MALEGIDLRRGEIVLCPHRRTKCTEKIRPRRVMSNKKIKTWDITNSYGKRCELQKDKRFKQWSPPAKQADEHTRAVVLIQECSD